MQVQPVAPAAPAETAEERQRRQMEGVPDLPPLLAQILAETRAKQARARERAEQGLPPEEEEEKAKGRAGKEGGPLLLEGPKFMVATHDQPIPKELSDSEEDSDEGEADAPPGPPDAARCRAHGPGFSGAAAGAPVSLTITCRDATGKRVREGGAFILVMVEPTAAPSAAGGEEPEPIQAEVKDHGNGTYTASYEVPTKGNYQLHIEVNGEPLGGSPFPVFFSAPVPQPAAAPAAPAPGAAQPPAADAGAQQAAATTALAGALAGIEAAAMGVVPAAPQLDPKVKESLGFQLAQMGLRIPAKLSEEDVRCIVVVGNVPPSAKSDAVEAVFSKCGRIRSCTLVGIGSGFAFVEFSREKGAAAAMEMKDPQLMGQPLKLELAADARKAGDATRAFQAQMSAPNLALQMAQRQQFELLQQQQAALAAQVAAMRAAQRAGGVPALAPVQPHSNDSQKSAAIAAAIALSKKLAGGGGAAAAAAAPAAANGDEKRGTPDRRRSRSRSRDKRRRSRSRSPNRRRSRSRDKGRRRSRSRERRLGRDSSRDRHRRRSRSRSRDKHRHKHRHHKDREHKERRRRSRSRSRDRRERSERHDKAGADKMEVDAPAPAAAAEEKKAEQPADELEALLEELGD